MSELDNFNPDRSGVTAKQYILGRRDKSSKKGVLGVGKYLAVDGSTGSDVYIDCLGPHAMLICGKRGYGKSYTTFEYSDIKLSSEKMSSDDTLEITLTVTNKGKIDGDEIVQLYISDKEAGVEREVKALKGFSRVSLKAGESKSVTFKIDKSHLSFYDIKKKKWVAESGEFEVLIGASSRDIRLKSKFKLIN